MALDSLRRRNASTFCYHADAYTIGRSERLGLVPVERGLLRGVRETKHLDRDK